MKCRPDSRAAARTLLWGEKCVWVRLMPALPFSLRTSGARIAAAACFLFVLGVSGTVSTAEAQSDAAAMAPWQAHPCEGQQVPAPDKPCDGDGPCGIGLRCGRACGEPCGEPCGEGPCDEECNVATDWLRMFQPRDQLSFRAEYLAWWTKSPNSPALVTTNTGAVPTYNDAGVLPGATILYSGENGDPGAHSGARFDMGYWFTPCRWIGGEVIYTFLGDTASTFTANGAQYPVLAMPYYNVAPNGTGEYRYVLAYPAVQDGDVTIRNTQQLCFVEALSRWSLIQQCGRNLDFVFGYRYGRFAENLNITSNTTYPAAVQRTDLFEATNEFQGFEMGFISTTRYCRWSLDVLMKLALGNTRSRVDVSGDTTGQPAGAGGLFALSTNSGVVERRDFSTIPELGLTLGYDLNCRLKMTVGYTFLYWSSVMRPADQIDRNINTLRIPPGRNTGVPQPESKSVMTDFWAQGINIGLDYRY
jgi:hypothetical protein